MATRAQLALTPGIAGVDEAGRGPLAGPVVAAAVLLPADFNVELLDDSKKLSAEQRRVAEREIRLRARFALVCVPSSQIDRVNILQATLYAMQLALERVCEFASAALIDGNSVPPMAPMPCTAVVKGDGAYASIAAASILAKTERDRLMVELGREYPQYGFERHFGYPTPEHLAALRLFGPCPLHRRSFEPVRSLALQPCLSLGD